MEIAPAEYMSAFLVANPPVSLPTFPLTPCDLQQRQLTDEVAVELEDLPEAGLAKFGKVALRLTAESRRWRRQRGTWSSIEGNARTHRVGPRAAITGAYVEEGRLLESTPDVR